mgnify:CR=1 FL=1
MANNLDDSVDLFSLIHQTPNNDNLFNDMGYDNMVRNANSASMDEDGYINNDILANSKDGLYDYSQQLAFAQQNGANSDFATSRLPGTSITSLSPATNTSSISPNSDKSGNGFEETIADPVKKKKAQNRAAQRAFRERKEAKLATLEAKLKESESYKESLLKEVDELRRLNQEIHAENRTLLQRQDMEYREENLNNTRMDNGEKSDSQEFIAPTREDFYKELMEEANQRASSYNETITNKTYQDNGGNTIMTIPATWEYLTSLDNDDLNIVDVVQKLKGNEVCHGSGPAYPKYLIDAAIKEVQDDM